MLVHFAVYVAIAAAQLGFVVILAVNALEMLVFFTISADHYTISTWQPYFRTVPSQINFTFF